MDKSNLLVTATEDLKELLGIGKTYSVPRYQRDYSWKQELRCRRAPRNCSSRRWAATA